MGDIGSWLQSIGVLGALILIGVVVFAESGLFIGLFLPGDTLLFAAGFFAAQGELPLFWVIFVIFLGAVLGDNLGYFLGNKTGPRIFRNTTGVFFRQEYVERARQFYEKHGGKTVLFARFLPYARTFVPVVAGAASMRRRKFLFYNIAGALLWTLVFVLIGYWLGVELAERLERYLAPIFVVVLLIAFGPTITYFITNRRLRRALWQEIKTFHPKRRSRDPKRRLK
jgi:membrane-associated protein